MVRQTNSVVLIIEDDGTLANDYASWLPEYTVLIATDTDAVYDQLENDVDIVLLDRGFSETPSEEILSSILAHGINCQIGLLSAANTTNNVLHLDVDEHIPRPVNREEFRATVARLDDRHDVMQLVETYLTLVDRKRSFERRKDPSALEDDSHYKQLLGELVARRQQISSLLSQLGNGGSGADPDPSASNEHSVESPRTPGEVAEEVRTRFKPLYEAKTAEFYFLWLLAALTYGVGDVLTTVYAVATVPGLIEGNPIVNVVLQEFGLSGFLGLKLVIFLVLIWISIRGAQQHTRFTYYWPPIIMSGIGVFLTGWNLRVILGA